MDLQRTSSIVASRKIKLQREKLMPSRYHFSVKRTQSLFPDTRNVILLIFIFHLYQGLRRHLLEELDQAFPDEADSFRDIRAASAAVSSYYS